MDLGDRFNPNVKSEWKISIGSRSGTDDNFSPRIEVHWTKSLLSFAKTKTFLDQ